MSTTAGSPPQDRLPQDSSDSSDSSGPTAAPAPRSRRRLMMIGIGLVVIVLGGIWLARWWTVGRFIESTDDAYLQADSVTVAPKVSGYVTDVYVADNATVKAGDPLVRLDTRQYQVALDQARATIAARTADIQRAQADILQQHANIEQAKAQEQVARVSARHARDEVLRYAPLAATGAETSEHLAQLTSTRDQANATLTANSAAADAARTQIAATAAQIAQARAQLDAAQASAEQSQLDLRDTIVRSVLAGKVGDRSVRVGQYVQPGTRMLSVVPVQSTYLVANFKETQVGHMRAGQPVTLRLDALPGTDLHGVVDSFAPGTGAQFALLPPENATGNFTKIVQRVPVRIRINTGPETRSVLLPGLSVTAEVDTRSAREGDRRIEAENHHE
jgi:membrane fusion protein (multidrug efflux system)